MGDCRHQCRVGILAIKCAHSGHKQIDRNGTKGGVGDRRSSQCQVRDNDNDKHTHITDIVKQSGRLSWILRYRLFWILSREKREK